MEKTKVFLVHPDSISNRPSAGKVEINGRERQLMRQEGKKEILRG